MNSQITWSIIYPKKDNLQPEQLAYIQNYVDTVEQVIREILAGRRQTEDWKK